LRLLPDVGSAAIGAVVTIVLAILGTGPISVPIGFVVSAVLQWFLAVLVGVRVRPRWDLEAAREARHWMANVGLGAIVYAVVINIDFPIVSRILGTDPLGLYSLAFRVAWLPYLLLGVVLAHVAFPLYARLIRDGRQSELAGAVARFTHVLLVVVGGMYVIIMLLAERLVLLGERWAPAALPLTVLCAYGLGLSLLTLWYESIIVTGRVRQYLCFMTSHLLLLVVLLLVFARHGITAVAVAQTATVWALVAAVWVALRRAQVAPPVRDLARAILGFLVPAATCIGAVTLARWGGFEPDPSSRLGSALELFVLAACYAAIAGLMNRSLFAMLLKRRSVATQ
jgi:O-antigen/teichoic acid export membrane protein